MYVQDMARSKHYNITCRSTQNTMSSVHWNLFITDTFGEQCFGLYTDVALLRVHKLFIWDLGAWLLYEVQVRVSIGF